MGAELELVSDGSGLAVIGEEDAIEQFMLDLDLVDVDSRSLAQAAVDGAHAASGLGVLGLQAAGQFAAESGRWLKLTEESAAKVRAFGLQATKDNPTISHAMIGKPGDVQSWIQVVNSPAAFLTNPAALASIGSARKRAGPGRRIVAAGLGDDGIVESEPRRGDLPGCLPQRLSPVPCREQRVLVREVVDRADCGVAGPGALADLHQEVTVVQTLEPVQPFGQLDLRVPHDPARRRRIDHALDGEGTGELAEVERCGEVS